MEEIKLEEATYLGICKCCLKDGDFKSMWAEYSWEEEREVYGEMLKDSYNLDWQQPDESTEHIEQICETCIEKLRTAYYFKKQLLEAEQQLRNHFDNERKPMKYETNIIKAQVKEPVFDDDFEYEDVEFLEDEQEFFDSKLENNDQSINLSQFDEEYNQERRPGKRLKEEKKLDITKNYKQYLEYNIKKAVEAVRSKELTETEAALAFSVPKKILSDKILRSGRKLGQSVSEATPEPEDGEPNRKWPKRKKKSEITKNYRQYSEDDLRKAIEAVNNKELSQTEAALAFNIPKKTLSFKVRNSANKIDAVKTRIEIGSTKRIERFPTEDQKEEFSKYCHNIKIILKYSNATAIKRHCGVGYTCCYCPVKYKSPSELKNHVLDEHCNTESDYLRPVTFAEYIVKLDITDLYCKICKTAIDTYEKMIDHLEIKHEKVIYTDIPNHIIPFKFDDDCLRCVICAEEFNYFKILLEHMNVHYWNYKCKMCDAKFINKRTLQRHNRGHETGIFECTYCKKVFDTAIKKRSHEISVHIVKNKRNKCIHCGQKFGYYWQKKIHEVKVHGDPPVFYTCKICNKQYNNPMSLTTHRHLHLGFKRHKCTSCESAFHSGHDLKRHMLSHKDLREHKCPVCQNGFNRKSTLKQHMQVHEENRKCVCTRCYKVFMNKSALKRHLQSKHGVKCNIK